jgi:hypothetical protein
MVELQSSHGGLALLHKRPHAVVAAHVRHMRHGPPAVQVFCEEAFPLMELEAAAAAAAEGGGGGGGGFAAGGGVAARQLRPGVTMYVYAGDDEVRAWGQAAGASRHLVCASSARCLVCAACALLQ